MKSCLWLELVVWPLPFSPCFTGELILLGIGPQAAGAEKAEERDITGMSLEALLGFSKHGYHQNTLS